ncbi:hypothetical protein DFJ77DRAFT_211791 [Powellomyces hirtus]|nr:hypothetical protein DFJ77DRAFT_211791 [Powellomyces hirtus]
MEVTDMSTTTIIKTEPMDQDSKFGFEHLDNVQKHRDMCLQALRCIYELELEKRKGELIDLQEIVEEIENYRGGTFMSLEKVPVLAVEAALEHLANKGYIKTKCITLPLTTKQEERAGIEANDESVIMQDGQLVIVEKGYGLCPYVRTRAKAAAKKDTHVRDHPVDVVMGEIADRVTGLNSRPKRNVVKTEFFEIDVHIPRRRSKTSPATPKQGKSPNSKTAAKASSPRGKKEPGTPRKNTSKNTFGPTTPVKKRGRPAASLPASPTPQKPSRVSPTKAKTTSTPALPNNGSAKKRGRPATAKLAAAAPPAPKLAVSNKRQREASPSPPPAKRAKATDGEGWWCMVM